ncbi:hypothetical protein Kpol_478p11 [Vanderwaltozyma polyspora DSM 70294]|uniref:Transcription initiation factor IIF subunit alpha n=1 Tax=Vanderwaltozyma polyspora (strain ATCC 22028 / DSM 70294 / BCRC 21397 / CBS 2163 / NBRC 10782 / NRRL Y-8283 / UCD 57-17) TaxID=436907 RepID=A7TPN0_VANPO|nr:uncharacterized protein Kpol_478p11 [Vanderwaltozyma polyspora DSM 70294]EDO15775.1 hypothetical protein Kpol_478p11 [Vanderwaltozyma polyspora DSM 70294]
MRRSTFSRSATPSGGGGTGSVDASPFIKPDRNRRNFLRARMGARNGGKGMLKKDDPGFEDERNAQLLQQTGVEVAGRMKLEDERGEVYNEFPLRAISRENLENMRTHLLKFQSKKKINPSNDFHLPIRLHRKDTRNLQFQLTRAEIVERQKEIAEYKKAQINGGPNTGNMPNNIHPKSQNVPTPVANGLPPTNPLDSKVNGPEKPPAMTPSSIDAGSSSTGTSTPSADNVVKKEPDGNNVPNQSTEPGAENNPNIVVTKLEDAGPAEDPSKVGLVKYDGKEAPAEEEVFEAGTMDPLADVAPDGGGRAKRGNSRRKTRQIKVLDENAKKLRFEEFYPWVMEDFDGYNTWVGSYEAGNSDSYVMLAVEDDGSFTMIPADKVYKFTARNKYATLTIEEAEKRMDKKSGEVPRWLMKHLDNIGTTTTRYDRTRRRLKAVADQRRNIEGSESEHDDNSEVELDYDEEFADDEEAPIIDGNEQENKESEQRIKKEMLQANAMGLRDDEQLPDDTENDNDLFGEKKIDEEGERIKKALQKTELAALYSSDEGEINPYLSESDLENKENEKSPVKKESSDELPTSRKSSPKKQMKSSAKTSYREPQVMVKSIKDCIIILKADKKVLENFAPGEWNPEVSKRKREEMEQDQTIESDETTPETKKIKTEESESVPLITEQDVIDAIGNDKVNVKDFGKSIRKRYPGPENKKLMFAIVKKLCRKVDNEHMELKK